MSVGRNDPCPCGSGRKFKHCCGKAGAAPEAAPTTAATAWALLNQGLPGRAEAECTRLITGAPARGELWLCLALAQSAQGKDALASLQRAAHLLPTDATAQHLFGQSLEDHRDLPAAADAYRRAVALNPRLAEAHSDLGNVLLQLGKAGEAAASCQRALAVNPRLAAALGNLGNAERARGAHQLALASYRQLVELEPASAEAHHHLGSTLLEAGQPEAAIVSLRQAISLRPVYPSAVRQLARALSALGRGAEALPMLERLKTEQLDAGTLGEYAGLLVSVGQFEAAAGIYRKAIDATPGDARLHAGYGHAMRCLGSLQGAAEECRKALALDPTLPEAYAFLGNALLGLSDVLGAVAAYSGGLKVASDYAPLHTGLATAYRRLGRLDEASRSAHRALTAAPADPDAIGLIAELALDHGRFTEAEAQFRAALAVQPMHVQALVGIAKSRRMTSADADWLSAARQSLALPLAIDQRAALNHAIGKFSDDLGDYAAAFSHHAQANEIARSGRPAYDRENRLTHVARIRDRFSAKRLQDLRHELDAVLVRTRRPVFVIGMPRSGTTLVEQILASHPDVHGAGELIFWNLAAAADRGTPEADRAKGIALAERDYLAELKSRSASAARVVDKLPGNVDNVGLIHLALPDARIVHLERDPVDTCLSVYFQDFSSAHAYATDFGDLAHYYRSYLDLMTHWRSVLPAGIILDVPYEQLVGDPETWSRRMVDHVGLPWDPRCLDFHRTDRAVLTASSWQVRQPIAAGSVQKWRRYGTAVEPLRDALRFAPEERKD